MTNNPNVSECANPNCRAKFKRFGAGRISVFIVDNPAAWVLPDHTKMKAVWLCEACAQDLYIRVDLRQRVIEAVRMSAA